MGFQYDFSSPFASARIVKKDGTLIPLWAIPEAELHKIDKKSLPALAIVTEIIVELQLALLPRIIVTMTPPLQDVVKILDSDLIEWGESLLEVQLGYVGGAAKGPVLTPVFTGLLLKPDVSIGADSSITLTGFGTLFSATTSGAQEAKKGTRKALIEMFAKGWGPIKRNIDVKFDEALKDDVAAKELSVAIEEAPGGRSDWFVIWKLARQCGCWPWQIGNELRIVPKNTMMTKQPKYKFAFFPGATFTPNAENSYGIGQNALLPILSASTAQMGALYLPGVGRKLGQMLNGIDPDTGQAFKKFIDDSQARPSRSKDGAAAPEVSENHPGPDEATGDGSENTRVNRPDSLAVTQAVAEFTAATAGMGIRIDVETVGVPNLLPADAVQIDGLGERLRATNYGVFKVVHSWNSSGFATSFTCVSNTAQMLHAAQQVTGPVGQSEVDAVQGAEVKVEAKKE